MKPKKESLKLNDSCDKLSSVYTLADAFPLFAIVKNKRDSTRFIFYEGDYIALWTADFHTLVECVQQGMAHFIWKPTVSFRTRRVRKHDRRLHDGLGAERPRDIPEARRLALRGGVARVQLGLW